MSIVDVMKMKNNSTAEAATETLVVPTTPVPTRSITILPKNVESLIIFLTDGELRN